MSVHEATKRVADCMDQILTNFKDGAKITVLVRYPEKPNADFCLTDDDLDEVIAMVQRRKGEAPPQPNLVGDGWFSQVVSFLVKHGMLDEREEYDISDVMTALVDNYEPRSNDDGDAIDAIQRLMETNGLARKDIFPAKSRASEYLSRKRPLPIATIRKLHFEHGIPAEVLISPYRSTAGEMP